MLPQHFGWSSPVLPNPPGQGPFVDPPEPLGGDTGTVTGQAGGCRTTCPTSPSTSRRVSAFSSAPAARSLRMVVSPASPWREMKHLGWFLVLGMMPGLGAAPWVSAGSCREVLDTGLIRGAPARVCCCGLTHQCHIPSSILQRSSRVSHEQSLALLSSLGGETEAQRRGLQVNRKIQLE